MSDLWTTSGADDDSMENTEGEGVEENEASSISEASIEFMTFDTARTYMTSAQYKSTQSPSVVNQFQHSKETKIQFDIESTLQTTQTKEKLEDQRSEKNYIRTIITFSAILVTVGILVIFTFILISRARDSSARDIKSAISLAEFLNSTYVPNRFNGTWISDEEIQYLTEDGDVVNFSVTDGSSVTILNGTEFLAALNISKSKIFQASTSADESFILIGHSVSAVFGGPPVAKFEAYDVDRGSFTAVLPNASNPDDEARLLQAVSWAPVGNALAFIHEHDIYYMASASDSGSVDKITADGSTLLSNGIADAFSADYADAGTEKFQSEAKIFWSPRATRLGFLEYDIASVEQAKISWYGEPGDFETFQYTYQSETPYAKPGSTNPAVSIVTVSLCEDEFYMTYHKSDIYPGVPADHILRKVEWISESEFIVEILSRNQNESFTLVCGVVANCRNLFTMRIPNGWVRWDRGTTISQNSTALVTLTSQKQNSGLAYHHILWVSMIGGRCQRSLTSGDFSIDDIIGWDEDRHRVYFAAPHYDFVTNNSKPSQTHLYYISDKDTGSIPTCVTCPLKNSQNETCLFNEVSFSSDYTYFAHTCAGPYSVPEVTIRDIDDKMVTVWDSNSSIRRKLATVQLPAMRNFDIQISNNFTAKARLWFPPNFDPTRKYPLFVYVYGGPETQEVKDEFGIDWKDHIVVTRDIIYAAIDGRGSGRQSDDLMFQVYRRLGSVEVDDQIEATKWLIDTTKFIDPKRTAIWGWSYGGYATAMVLAKDKGNVFQTGISVAPVTSWMLYKSVYAERYMGYPTSEDNLKGYNASDVSNYVENFRGKNFYLIHGNADENVHYQQSMMLTRALEKADILFMSQSYPDEGHSLGGVGQHLYHSIEKFLFDDLWNT